MMKTFGVLQIFNQERHITRCLASLSEIVDGIVVLDDGSTDRTPELLRQFAKVMRIIHTPSATKGLWHEGKNLTRLNLALREFAPDWVIRVDGDETFDAPIKEHLRDLVAVGPEVRAFEFPRYLYDESAGRCSVASVDIVRMYRYSPDSRFEVRRQHIRSEPVDIRGSETRRTNLRLWHHTGFSEQLRRERYEKFITSVDPFKIYQRSYENILKEPQFVAVPPWAGRLEIAPCSHPKRRALFLPWEYAKEAGRVASHLIQQQFRRT